MIISAIKRNFNCNIIGRYFPYYATATYRCILIVYIFFNTPKRQHNKNQLCLLTDKTLKYEEIVQTSNRRNVPYRHQTDRRTAPVSFMGQLCETAVTVFCDFIRQISCVRKSYDICTTSVGYSQNAACYYLFSVNLDFYIYSFSSYILKFIFINFIILTAVTVFCDFIRTHRVVYKSSHIHCGP